MHTTANGSCFCKAVKFQIELPVKEVLHCHCNMCRRLSGSDYTSWVIVPDNKFSLTKGKENLSSYAVSEQCNQTFCKTCGTRITTTDKKYAGIISILRGTISDDINNEASAEFYMSDKAPWFHLVSSLPKFGGETGTEPLTEAGE